MILMVPPDDGLRYPSLGEQVVAWMHENLVFGPGDLRGEPLELDAEQQAFIWRFYELFPKGHPIEGRRRFARCALSLAKGLRKTELAACVAAAELHPDAPVRFNGWNGRGLATGRGVTDPFVVLVAYTEEQSDELAYGALKTILEESPICHDFDIGLERITRRNGDGKAVSISGSPNARDGARTTFQCFDETHWHTLPRLIQAHRTMIQNTAKRKIADPWSLEITTAPEPGAGSIAEKTMEYAEAVKAGTVTDANLFFFHRQAGDEHDLNTRDGARAAVIEASGAAASWRDIDAIVSLWSDPTTDRTYWERVWCNRLVKSAAQAFNVVRWKELKADPPVALGDVITLGFDGSQFHDSTGIVATHVQTGYQWPLGLWECPIDGEKRDPPWQVPASEVDAVVRRAFADYRVWRMYADPPYWQSWIAQWQGVADWQDEKGKPRVQEWWTTRRTPMTAALENFDTAIRDGTVSHDGDPRVMRHLGNARKQELPMRDEDGKALWLIRKERPDSPHKIDLGIASVLSWEARSDAIAAGALTPPPQFQMFFAGGVK
jgi:phage terminase large subunit-like protein